MNAPMKQYDRTTQDVGNIVLLEHFNVIHTDQRLATLFYVAGLGGTRDPYLFVGLDNMWVNFGRTQAHLPSRGDKSVSEVLRGTIGIVVPDLGELKQRLAFAGSEMKRVAPEIRNKFSFREKDNCVEATCPWGNRFRLHAPSAEYPRTDLGLAYIDFDVPPGTAEGIARFYAQIMKCPSGAANGRATVPVSRNQKLFFTETKNPIPEYDGHHIQVYISEFSGPYKWLLERGLINMETDECEWRFQWIVDPADGRKLFQIEHEVRSTKHWLYNRPLVNRNHAITNLSYLPGSDAFKGTY
jgi:hypothetical protein